MLEAWGFSWFKNQREELIHYLNGMGYHLFFFNSTDAIAQHYRSKRYVNFVVDSVKNTLHYHVTDNSQMITFSAAS
jgi:hypothetical protein